MGSAVAVAVAVAAAVTTAMESKVACAWYAESSRIMMRSVENKGEEKTARWATTTTGGGGVGKKGKKQKARRKKSRPCDFFV